MDAFFAGVDANGYQALGVGGLLLVLLFRTLWRQDGGWEKLAAAQRSLSEEARSEAKAAHEDAAAAREDARLARDEAAHARREAQAAQDRERRCELRMAAMSEEIAELRRLIADR